MSLPIDSLPLIVSGVNRMDGAFLPDWRFNEGTRDSPNPVALILGKEIEAGYSAATPLPRPRRRQPSHRRGCLRRAGADGAAGAYAGEAAQSSRRPALPGTAR